MATFMSFPLVALAIFLAIPVAVFVVEVIAAVALRPRELTIPDREFSESVAVLVPAHNESVGILPTLADIKPQLRARDHLVVVADNCTDDTAAVAAAAGGEVVTRNDSSRKGKGYALAWGLRHLSSAPPNVVIVIDADCNVPNGTIEQLRRAVAITARPVQALSGVTRPDKSSNNLQVAEFAWLVKNLVRPCGLRNIGLPCQLMGTAMAFPWDIIRLADLASGSLVEDLKLGLDLALAGHPALFHPFPGVTSRFASTAQGTKSQRLRWEQGSIATARTSALPLVLEGITRRNVGLLALGFDVAVPPLSLLSLLLTAMLVVSGLATMLGASSVALLITIASTLAFMLGVFLSWLGYGRDILPLRSILSIPSYLISKFPMYWRIFFSKSAVEWIRTDRRRE